MGVIITLNLKATGIAGIERLLYLMDTQFMRGIYHGCLNNFFLFRVSA